MTLKQKIYALNKIKTGECEPVYMFYNYTSLQCERTKTEYESCDSSIQCLSPMSCNGDKCQCASTEYFAESSLSCVPRTLNNSACASNNTCRVDLGLSCQSAFCQCDLTAKFWHESQGNCIDFMTYDGKGCSVDANCIASQSLICNLDATANKCDCMQTSVNNMCDCKRMIGGYY